MDRRDARAQKHVHRSLNARASLCGCKRAHDSREAGHSYRRVEGETLERLLDCGDLRMGFPRVHCNRFGYE